MQNRVAEMVGGSMGAVEKVFCDEAESDEGPPIIEETVGYDVRVRV